MAEILRDALSQPGEGGAEFGAQFVFLGLARLAEIGVIAILFAALLVPADRLDVAVGPGAEPGVGISGRQGARVPPVDLGAIRDARAVRIPTGPPAAPLRPGAAGGTEARREGNEVVSKAESRR